MAQTNFTPILLYASSTAAAVPLAANLTNSATGSEIAINVADKNLFFKDSTNAVNTVPIRQSGTSSNGWLSSTDWNTFNNKQPAGTYVTSVTGTAPVVSSGGTTPAISMAAATTSVNGYLTNTDWNTFNNKQAALVSGTNIKTVNGTTLLGSGDLGTIAVAYGGTGASSASITSFNNITGYTASGATGTTSTNIVFSTSPTLTTPKATTTIGVGNATPSASGSGITFPATVSDSSNANTLDDYEEGTWTPTWTGLVTSGSVSKNIGYYVKVGRVVYYAVFLQYTTSFTTTQGTTYHTLPFTPAYSSSNTAANVSNAVNIPGIGLTFSGSAVSYVPSVAAGITEVVFTATYYSA